MVASFQIRLIGLRISPISQRLRFALRKIQGSTNFLDYGLRNFDFETEYGSHLSIVTLRPNLSLARGVDQPCTNPYPLLFPADRPLQDQVYAQLLGNLLNTLSALFIEPCRCSGNYVEMLGTGLAQLGDHFFRNPVAKIVLIGILAQTLER